MSDKFMQITATLQKINATDLLIAVAGITLILAAIIIAVWQKTHVVNKTEAALAKKKKQRYWLNMYQLLSKNRITQRHVDHLTKRLELLSVYREEEIQAGVAKFTAKLYFSIIGSFVLGCIFFNDLLSITLLVMAAYVIYQTHVENSIQSSVLRVYRELKQGVASVRLEYKKTKDVLVSLENATVGNRVVGIFNDIKQVVSSTRGQQALNEYYDKVPFKEVQTFAMICYNINDTGDEFTGDTSTFDQSLLVMNSDINQKIEKLNYEKLKFGKLEWLAMVGIVMTVVIKMIISRMLPSAAILYNSIVGIFIQNGVIGYSIYAYWSVAHAHIQAFMDKDDRPDIVKWMMRKDWFLNLCKLTIPDGKKRRIMAQNLEKAFSKQKPLDFHAQKLTFAFFGFVATTIIVFTAPMIEYNYISNYTGSFSLTGSVNYKDDKGNIIMTHNDVLKMDKAYINTRNAGKWDDAGDIGDTSLKTVDENNASEALAGQDITTQKEIDSFILSYMPKATTMDLSDQRQRLEAKYQKLKNNRFHWYYIFLTFIAAFIGYKIPDRTLKKRIELAKEEEEEEFLQLQIVMLVLASMNFDTLETLSHLAQIADIHKASILKCYYGYASNPKEELERLGRTTQSENFKQFIAKLKETIEDLSIKEAFADLEADREHIMNERSAYIKEMIDKKRSKMGQVALRPMLLAVYGMLVFPLMYTGITGLIDITEQISDL